MFSVKHEKHAFFKFLKLLGIICSPLTGHNEFFLHR